MKKINLQKIKETLPQISIFFLANILSIAVGALVIILLGVFAGGLIEYASQHRFWSDLIIDICLTAGFGFIFYFRLFVSNKTYKRFYFKKMEEGLSLQAWKKAHLAEYAKYEFFLLLVISVIPVIVPNNSWVSFLYTSAVLFVDFLPVYLFTGIPFTLAKLIGIVLFDACMVGLYLLCLRLVPRNWEKTRLRGRSSD